MTRTRTRNNNGQYRQKRGDTHLGTIEEKYGIDLGRKSDMHLGAYLDENNIESLNDLITGK